MHKFPRSLAMVSVLAPAGVNALGLGDLTLHSALNQDLDAEIPLIAAKSESIADIQVSLASPEAFADAGIERNFSLSNIRFKPVIRPDGSTAIKVTSKGVVREPLLNFLVEVNWPMGRMYREFTILLDPPVTLGMPTDVVQAAPVAGAFRPDFKAPASQRQFSQSRENVTSSYPQAGIRYSGEEIGPTRRNDTLWDIAKRARTSGSTSHEQMMMALFEHNPHAFYKNNVNALKAGHVLRVPPHDMIVRRTPGEARDEFYQQYAVWQSRMKDKAKGATEAAALPKNSQKSGQAHLSLEAQADDVLSANSGRVNKTTGAKAELAMEIADTVSQENEELRSRVDELESQLEKLQRMLTLRNGNIAPIQADSSKASEAESTDRIVDQGDSQGAEPLMAPEQQIAEQPEEINASDQSPNNEATLSTEAETSDEAATQAPVAVAPAKQKNVPPVQRPEAQPEEEGGLTLLLSDPIYLIAGGTGLTLLVLLGWMIMRRHRQELNDAMESILAVPDNSSTVSPVDSDRDENQAVKEIGTVAESSFLSEFAPSDFDALDSDADEVDPVSEADVYLAYGRYQQAEDLIRQAIEKDPARDECKLKLLEIFFANENASAFENYAKELKNANKGSDAEFWSKIVEMGVELCPASALFSGDFEDSPASTEEVETFTGEEKNSVSEAFEDLEMDFDVNQTEADDHADNRTLEFDLSSNEESENPDDFEFDLTDVEPIVGTNELSAEEVTEIKLSGDDNEGESLEDIALQFDDESKDSESIDALDEAMSGISIQEENGADRSLASEGFSGDEFTEETDLTLESVSLADATVVFGDVVESEVNEALDSDGVNPGSAPLAESMSLSDEEEANTLANLDEVETKLDLAKAYIDMEDEKAAREMLREVIGAGNDEQKIEAEDLIGKLASNG